MLTCKCSKLQVTYSASLIPGTCPSPPPLPPQPPSPPLPPAPPSPSPPYGYVALLALKSSITSAWPDALSNWQPGVNPCTPIVWTGVTCTGTSIIGLDLSYYNLMGSLPDLWYGLTTLQSLSINNNLLYGRWVLTEVVGCFE